MAYLRRFQALAAFTLATLAVAACYSTSPPSSPVVDATGPELAILRPGPVPVEPGSLRP